MTQTSYELCKFKQDHRLANAWDAYVQVTDTFKRTYNRQPNCDLFVGAVGDREEQHSIITLRWTDVKGAEDAQLLVNLYAIISE